MQRDNRILSILESLPAPYFDDGVWLRYPDGFTERLWPGDTVQVMGHVHAFMYGMAQAVVQAQITQQRIAEAAQRDIEAWAEETREMLGK